ncbi:hypothetical protein EDC48_11497 [Gibbsiella quercinecans]|nr:hypothetical protein EDC48_11497 [Gibbsiella quercinecans]
MSFYSPRRIVLYTAAVIAILVIVGLVTHFTVGWLN